MKVRVMNMNNAIKWLITVLVALFLMTPTAARAEELSREDEFAKMAQFHEEIKNAPDTSGYWFSTLTFDNVDDLTRFATRVLEQYTLGDQYEYRWEPVGDRYVLGVSNTFNWKDSIRKHEAALAQIPQIATEIEDADNSWMTVYNIYNYIRKDTEYKEAGSSPYDIINGIGYGNCSDFSTLFYYIAKEKGLDCHVVIGWYGDPTYGHAWVQVNAGDDFWVDYELTDSELLALQGFNKKEYHETYVFD